VRAVLAHDDNPATRLHDEAGTSEGAMSGDYFVYLLASKRNGTLYVGVTSDLLGRVWEHKAKVTPGFTSKYGVDKLMWFEQYEDIREAIGREKQIKRWKREWKIDLFRETNPDWDDLYPGLTKGLW
jgi:putative endonuclease